jgi:sugar phosphate isomerase/epimerase
MRIGYNTWSMATVPYTTFIPALADIGYRAIAISVVPSYRIAGHVVDNAAALDNLTKADWRNIKQDFKERQLQLPSVVANRSLVGDERQEAMEFLRKAIDVCVEVAIDDVPTLNTGTGGRGGELDDPHTQAMIVDALGELSDYAASRGVQVCIEPHVNAAIDTIERAEWLVRTIGRTALRLDFDVSHFEVQAEDMEQAIVRLTPLSGAAEIKDQRWRVSGEHEDTWYVPGNGSDCVTLRDGRQLEFQFLLGGEGTFDLVRYLQLMKQQGFTRPVAFEASVQCQARPGYDALAAASSTYEWMASAWRNAGVSLD